MGRSYTVNRAPKRPSQFPYVCSLLVFLVFLLLIYLLSYFLKSSAGYGDQGGSALGSKGTRDQTTKTIQQQNTPTQSSITFETSIFTESVTSTTVESEIHINTKQVQDIGMVQTTQNNNVTFTTSPSTPTRVVNVTSISHESIQNNNATFTTSPVVVNVTSISHEAKQNNNVTFTTSPSIPTRGVNVTTISPDMEVKFSAKSPSHGGSVTEKPSAQVTFNNASTTNVSSNTHATQGTTIGEKLTTGGTKIQRILSTQEPQFTLNNTSTVTVTQRATTAENINIVPLLQKTTPNNSALRENIFTSAIFAVNNLTSKTQAFSATATPFTTTIKTRKPMEPVKFLRIVSEGSSGIFFTNTLSTSTPLPVMIRYTSMLEPVAPTNTEKRLKENEVALTNPSTTSSSLHITNSISTQLERRVPTATEEPLKFEENTTYLNRIVTSSISTKSMLLMNEDFSSKKLSTNAVCEIPECKRLAAEMLVLQNHDVTPCDDFYNYACGGAAPLDHTRIHDRVKKSLLKALHLDSNVPEIFKNFYFNCRNFSLDFYLLEPGRGVEWYEADANKLFVELTLLQTLHFFDVTLGITEGSHLIIEITPANLFPLHVLKTTIDRFSVFEYFRSKCVDFEKLPPTINGSTKSSVLTCVFDKMTEYVRRYCKQKSCESKVLNVLLELLDFQRRYDAVETVNMDHSFNKIRHLPRNKIGLDWLKYFQALFPDISEDTIVVVNFSGYFQELWKKFEEHADSIQKALVLWHNIQSYKRSMNILSDNNEDSCLDMSIELMPDIGTFLVRGQRGDTTDQLNKTIFRPVVKTLASYIAVENLTDEYRSNLLMKLNNIELQSTVAINYQQENYRGLYLEESKGHGQYDIVQALLRNYRKVVYSLVGSEVNPKILLTFFVNPLDVTPKAFGNTNYIVYHPRFVSEYSPSLPLLIQMAKFGYPLSRELWKLLLDYESDGENYSFSLKSHDPRIYNSLVESLFANQPLSSESPIQESMRNELVIENAAFRLITETYKRYPMNEDSLIYMNFTHTASEIYTLAAVQELCMGRQPGKIALDISKDTVPVKMIVDNIVMNSKFFFNTFHCDDDHTNFNAQFPFVRTDDLGAFGVED